MADPSKRTVLGGRYRLDSLLGQGGMGTVHRALDLKLDRPVAVKVVDAHSRTPDIHARFVREARRTAQIRHPHVVEVFDHGETDSGDLYFVMELLEGEPLSVRLARDGRLSLGRFFRIAREMCEGLGAEVDDLHVVVHAPLRDEHHVGGLHVTVHDPERVGGDREGSERRHAAHRGWHVPGDARVHRTRANHG